ncbi:HNH endonuclease signature motif containing protein [Agrobacterium fabacearum]|uniref:HNH endonuclease signature motif containing protein n=1 Tax=Agrobacterium tumefaciens TaxID=358 RepID=UPI0028535829|nr:HNH endonuclease signature motif containing protein [Agrobacterium tumefaciens]MDR5008328.1 HNH endonuclease signature motif containing protein [Agrobacterium tumefaciens]
MGTVDIERLRSLISYDAETGKFTWRPRVETRGYERRFNREKAGQFAGDITNKGYVRVKIEGVTYSGHRLAWMLHYGEEPEKDIDHINRKRDDNRISNLRLATPTLNGGNQSISSNNTSGAKGVYFVKKTGRWRARIFFGDGSISLGTYADRESAKDAYMKGAANLFGEYATGGEKAA